MLVVTDLNKLKNYGFKQCTTTDIYELILYGNSERGISLLVNPYDSKYSDYKNAIVTYASVEGQEREFDLDEVGNLDVLFDMIADGVVVKADSEDKLTEVN